MIDDLHEPLELYLNFFKDAHARTVAQFFENLVHQSEIDERANTATVRELRELERQAKDVSAVNRRWKIVLVLFVLAMISAGVYIYLNAGPVWLIFPGITAVAGIYIFRRIIADISNQLGGLEQKCNAKRKEAWLQMAPLNQLHDWDIATKLVQETVPRLAFDRYFTNGRLNELQQSFGWDGALDDDRSIVYAHSGVINGNPFVLARSLEHSMGSKTYHGSLQISWTESVRDSNGNWTTETHHETLHASVEEPFPNFYNRTFILYGNEAAPDLSFRRSPSALSKQKDDLIGNWKKHRAVKKLEAKARAIESNKGFTVMSNKEFDALFAAMDRDHEVQFRLLFTPLAQQEMLKLLKDSEIGYGDDFEFIKRRMINIVEPVHMRKTEIDAGPERFHFYELAQARQFFNSYHNDFFRSFYFGIAPLMAIPLYQQHRSHADIYRDVYSSRSCFWEHESIANFYGERTFEHPKCVTRSILKTNATAQSDGTQTVTVTASGFGGVERVTYVPVHGGDGHTHRVPVHWTEYFPVQRDSTLQLQDLSPELGARASSTESVESERDAENSSSRGPIFANAVLRRSIYSAIATSQI